MDPSLAKRSIGCGNPSGPELAKGNVVRGVFLTKARAERAAESVAAVRGLLKSWHGFYAGYDPLFTWWTAAPFKEADGALEKYAAVSSRTRSTDRPTQDKPDSGRPRPCRGRF